jgi:hypothetical protein
MYVLYVHSQLAGARCDTTSNAAMLLSWLVV